MMIVQTVLLRWRGAVFAILAISLFATLGLGALWTTFGGNRPWVSLAEVEKTGAVSDTAKIFIVHSRSLNRTLAITGAIAPGRIEEVNAPFSGYILKAIATYGQAVDAEAPLVQLDASDLDVQIRTATAEYLKAEQVVNGLAGWDSSPEVTRARRALLSAKVQRDQAERNAASAKRLLDDGIIARQDYDAAEVQRQTTADQYANADQEYRQALARGDSQVRTIAELDLKNSRQKLDTLTQEEASAVVRAPQKGILLRPPTPEGHAAILEAGQHVEQGQTLFALGDAETLELMANVDEVDEPSLDIGQKAAVTGDGFPGVTLTGHVSAIAAVASTDNGSGRLAQYQVIIGLDPLSQPVARQIKLGMTAAAVVDVFASGEAIVVPATAVRDPQSGPWVEVRNHQTGETMRRAVTVGDPTINGVQIIHGLADGDELVLPSSMDNGANRQ